MNRLSDYITVLAIILCYGCSSETNTSNKVSFSDISERESSIIIISNPSSAQSTGNSTLTGPLKLTDLEKEILKQSIEQVKSVISIAKEIVDSDSALTSINKLCEARSALQQTRKDFRKAVSNHQRHYRIFTSEEGKQLQEAMWKMKNELARLEKDSEIQTILTDGMENQTESLADSDAATDERKELTVTADQLTSSKGP